MLLLKGFQLNDERDEKTLDVAVRDGMAHAVTIGAAETYFGAFGIFLKATAVQIGILAALPPIVGAFAQVFSLKVLEHIRSRRFLVVSGARMQASSLILLVLLPFVVTDPSLAVPALIVFVMLYQASAGLTLPLWNSLIGDLVPAERRGRFFGFRNQRAGISTFLATLGAGWLLNYFQGLETTAIGFAIVFAVASASRFVSAYWLSRYDDPEYLQPPESYFSFWQFVTRARYSNFAKFVFFVSCIHFGAAMSAPYFAVYMLRDLQFPYWEFTVVVATVTVTQILTLQHWGRIADSFGSKKILNLCSIGVAINPALWIVSSNVWYLIFVQVFSGVVWAGFNLAVSTFLFDAVSSAKRARCAAYQAVVQGSFVLAGSLFGGFLAERLPRAVSLGFWTWEPRSPYLFLFLFSGLVRLASALMFRKRYAEVRDVLPSRSIGLIFHLFPINSLAEGASRIRAVSFRKSRPPSRPLP